MKTIYIILSILIAGMFFSCSKEVDFSGQLPPNKLVLNCFVEADSLISASVSRSWNLSQTGTEEFRDARVELYINGKFVEVLDSIGRAPDTPDIPEYFRSYKISLTHCSATKAHAGDVVKLVVRKAGFDDIESETIVPDKKAEIISIDSIPTYNEYGNSAMRFYIKFKDVEAGKKNYYRLVVELYSQEGEGELLSEFYTIGYDYDMDPALKEGFVSATDDILESGIENIYGIFNDDSFDGKEYSINISFVVRYSGRGYWSEEEDITTRYYQFRLVTLNESAYLYLKSRTNFDYNEDENPFVEPGIIYNNIKNGLGILGASNMDAKVLKMPVKEYPFYY